MMKHYKFSFNQFADKLHRKVDNIVKAPDIAADKLSLHRPVSLSAGLVHRFSCLDIGANLPFGQLSEQHIRPLTSARRPPGLCVNDTYARIHLMRTARQAQEHPLCVAPVPSVFREFHPQY